MYVDQANRRRIQPAGLAASLALSGLVVVALVNVAPQIRVKLLNPTFPIRNYVEPPPPPPLAEKPKPEIKAPRDESVVVPKPIIDPPPLTPPPPLDFTTEIKEPPAGPAIGSGSEPLVEKPVVAPPPPLILAQPDPRYASDFQPPYPLDKQRAGEEGRVTVKVLIGVDGRVKALEAVSGDPSFLEATRRQALSRWRFKPATRGSIPVESWQVLAVRFQLTD